MVLWQIDAELAEYKKIAKAADQKLRRLEAAYAKTKDEELLRYAYSRAMRDLKSLGLNNRFDVKLKRRTDVAEGERPEREIDFLWRIREATADAKRFINADTSSITGFKQLNAKRRKAFNETLGTNFTQKQFNQIMETGFFDLMKGLTPGYREAIKIAKNIVDNSEANAELFERRKKLTAKSIADVLDKYTYEMNPELKNIVNTAIAKARKTKSKKSARVKAMNKKRQNKKRNKLRR